MSLIRDIEELAKKNNDFRQVLETGKHTQVVIMSMPVGGDIGEEVHPETDQVLFCIDGEGKVILNGKEEVFEEGDLALVESGTKHNFINTGDEDMKILTFYSPPHHPQGTIHKTKEEAQKANY